MEQSSRQQEAPCGVKSELADLTRGPSTRPTQHRWTTRVSLASPCGIAHSCDSLPLTFWALRFCRLVLAINSGVRSFWLQAFTVGTGPFLKNSTSSLMFPPTSTFIVQRLPKRARFHCSASLTVSANSDAVYLHKRRSSSAGRTMYSTCIRGLRQHSVLQWWKIIKAG